MLPPGLETPRQVKQHYAREYDALLASGQYRPFLYPWSVLIFYGVLLYLLFDHRHRPVLRRLRIPLFGLVCVAAAWCIGTQRARSPVAAYGVGLVSAWGALWTGVLVVAHDCQTDFQRLERADESGAVGKLQDHHHHGRVAHGGAGKGDGEGEEEEAERRRQARIKIWQDVEKTSTQGPRGRTGPLIWQAYPATPSLERLDWVMDLFSNFRGIGWNFETSGVPAAPGWVEEEVRSGLILSERAKKQKNEVSVSRTGIRRFSDRRALLASALVRLAIGFVVLDGIKLAMQHDAYFWGYADEAAAPAWLPEGVRGSRALLRSYRLLLSLAGVYAALQQVFQLGPVVFSGLLGPARLGLRGEAWMNPADFFGDFGRAVCAQGLGGWWGAWWHQTFRRAFEAAATALLHALRVDPRSRAGRAGALLAAFALSGGLHACGSYTQLGDTRPIRGPFLFFVLQAVGILVQSGGAAALRRVGVTERVPRSVRGLTNLVTTHVWLYYTAPLLVDDFAKGGVWLYEPSPFSPLRAMGFGAADENGWDLWDGLVFWHRGEHWWNSGLGF